MGQRPTVGLLLIDKDRLSVRRGIVGAAALLGVLVLLTVLGVGATAAALGALVTVVSAGAGLPRVRVTRAAVVTVVGTALTLVGVWSGERGWTDRLGWECLLLRTTATTSSEVTASNVQFDAKCRYRARSWQPAL